MENRIKFPQDQARGSPAAIRLLTNLSGISTWVVQARDIAIATVHLRDVKVVVLPANPVIQDGNEDGLLPSAFFENALVNVKQGYGIFETVKSSSDLHLLPGAR